MKPQQKAQNNDTKCLSILACSRRALVIGQGDLMFRRSYVPVHRFEMWLCQMISRSCMYVRSRRLVRVVLVVFLVILYCEFLHYYVTLLWCMWPSLAAQGTLGNSKPLRAMFMGDTHILGSDAHWFDKLRREWQMVRSFQASMLLHNPDVVFILGDLLDNGKECSEEEFQYHVDRFRKMFNTPLRTKTEIIVGNHDVGFHYMMSERKHTRFMKAFDSPSVRLVQLGDVLFVLVNSMAMEGDGCDICSNAEDKLQEIKWKLKCAKHEDKAKVCETVESIAYTQPILLQHFPMFRESDLNCSTPDAAPVEERDVPFRVKYDCLSEDSTQKLFEWLDPRLVISAHTHHGCYRVHDNGVPEYTVASYNWRNKHTPTFLLAEISAKGYAISRCYLPNELTVMSIYILGGLLVIFCVILPNKTTGLASKQEFVSWTKKH